MMRGLNFQKPEDAMNGRLLFALAIVGLVALGVGLGIPGNDAAADSQPLDTCSTAVDEIYNDCNLRLRPEGAALSENSAVDYCRDQPPTPEKACWLGCPATGNDCGEIADCLDGCDGFNNDQTECGFIVDLAYTGCGWAFPDPETEEAMTKTEAYDDCVAQTAAEYRCFRDCTYLNWDDCDMMGECIAECIDPSADDDDDTDSDDDTDESLPTETLEDADGDSLSHVRGSSCGA